MNIGGINNATAPATQTTGSNAQVSQEEFLQLFLQQLQNQDPLNPMQGEEFLAQLATFSQLEQLTLINNGIDNLSFGQAAIVSGQTVGMIGKDVVYEGNETQLKEDSAVLRFDLPTDVQSAVVEIKDSNDIVVRRYDLEDLTPGERVETWNGRSDSGGTLPEGTYRFSVVATDAEGAQLSVQTTSSGVVDGVTYRNGVPELIIGDVRRSPSSVLEIK
ncbi:MAG: flagellar hook assembly protein FlgD [Myxococcota bacterium]